MGSHIARSSQPQKRTGPFRTIAVFIIVFLISCLILGGVGGVFLLMSRDNDRPEASVPPADNAPLNFLLIGRAENAAAGFVLIRLNFKQGKIPVLSVPPETTVTYLGREDTLTGHMQYGGVRQATGAVAEALGCPIDHYLMTDRAVLVNFIDKLGGINYYVPNRTTYGGSGSVLEAGNQRLTGSMAAGLLASDDAGRQAKDAVLTDICVTMLNQYLSADLLTRAESLYSFAVDKIETNLRFSDFYELVPQMESFFGTSTPAYAVDNGGGFVTRGGTEDEPFRFIFNDHSLSLIRGEFQ